MCVCVCVCVCVSGMHACLVYMYVWINVWIYNNSGVVVVPCFSTPFLMFTEEVRSRIQTEHPGNIIMVCAQPQIIEQEKSTV